MVYTDIGSQVVKNGEKSSTPITLVAPHKGTGSDSSDEEKEGQIRVGRDYQAVPPPFIPPSERREEHCMERALLVWSPSGVEEGIELDKFIQTAKEKFGYNGEQAMGLLFWHKYDVDRALQDLANFTPFQEEWGMEDKVMFDQAFQFHGKSFQRIRQMLPHKSIANLVKYYYSWKKTRICTSVMDSHIRKLTMAREEGLYGEENCPEAGSDSEEKEEKCSGKFRPPKGLNICQDDLVTLATGPELLEELDKDIASCKRLVQNNKQLISALHCKSRELGGNIYRIEQPEDVLSARWTEQELLLGVQGVRMCGNDFHTIASILGTKTAAQVETFFESYKHKFNLDIVLREWQTESDSNCVKF
eukprot:GFUD01017235.1.p1 GENE.GFUD01017235.1~~GFUD01017235.1.p1  ORF type:complete len:360 (-),score=113.32 GFUD01017235.1:130-1209(-)